MRCGVITPHKQVGAGCALFCQRTLNTIDAVLRRAPENQGTGMEMFFRENRGQLEQLLNVAQQSIVQKAELVSL